MIYRSFKKIKDLMIMDKFKDFRLSTSVKDLQIIKNHRKIYRRFYKIEDLEMIKSEQDPGLLKYIKDLQNNLEN